LIAFVGSVFSPYYRQAWRRGRGRADDHCALNVALYSPGARRWAMTERGHLDVQRAPHRFAIGPSSLQWRDGGLDIQVDEVANPLPQRVRGTVRVTPQGLNRGLHALDDAGRHRWGPIAACARVEVDFDAPGLRWQGHAYLDSNEGDEPITEPFTTWDWLRAPLPDGSTAVVYDVRQSGGRADRLIGLRFRPDGSSEPLPVPARHAVAHSGWRIARSVRSQDAAAASVRQTLEDTPFYARSVVRTRLDGHDVDAMHETLSASRFASPLVQAMLPWRMPRRAWSRSK
jgi:carotenoid 1,2-hydratase